MERFEAFLCSGRGIWCFLVAYGVVAMSVFVENAALWGWVWAGFCGK